RGVKERSGAPRLGACPEAAVHGSGGTVSASIRRRSTRVRERPTRSAPHRRSDGAPAPVLRRYGPRVHRARPPCEAAATPSARSDEATKAHRQLALRVPAKDVPYARGPNSAAGRRGRRRSAYEAPRAAADRGTRLGGAESKRRRRPRLPAPPSRVTLLRGPAGAAAPPAPALGASRGRRTVPPPVGPAGLAGPGRWGV